VRRISRRSLYTNTAVGAAVLALVTGLVTYKLRSTLDSSLAAAHSNLLVSLEPYRIFLENASGLAKRYDLYAQSKGAPDLKNYSKIIGAQMLQSSFGFTYEYFALRSLTGVTKIEVRKGAMFAEQLPFRILGEEDFRDQTVGLAMRPCWIGNEQFFCLAGFSLRQDGLPDEKRHYCVIAIPPSVLLSQMMVGRRKSTGFNLDPQLRLLLADHDYPITMASSHRNVASGSISIDRGVSLQGTISFASLARFVLTVIGLVGFLAAAINFFIKRYYARRLRSRVENAVMESRLKHLDEIALLAERLIHDIRSPIATLKTCIDSIHDNEVRSLVSHVIKRMTLIVHDLETQASLRPSVEGMVCVPVDWALLLLMREKEKEFASHASIQQKSIVSDRWVRGNYSAFMRAISNIMNNANEALTHGGTITVECRNSGPNKLAITIRDNGRGIPEEIKPHLFEKGCSIGKSNGQGLGLFYTKATIDEMGGDITVESSLEAGTSVTIEIPTIPSPPWAVRQIDLTDVKEVVVVDDEEAAFKAWQRKLRSSGVRLRWVKHPSELDGAAVRERRLVILDNRFGSESNIGIDFLQSRGVDDVILSTGEWQQDTVQTAVKNLGANMVGKEFLTFLEIST
jgi:signal transduction histidine kinase